MASILLFISFGETVVVLLAAWLLLGTKRLPDTARMLGKGLREFRKATADIRKELSDTPFDVVKHEVQSVQQTLQQGLDIPDGSASAAARSAPSPQAHSQESQEEHDARMQREADSFSQYYAAAAAADAASPTDDGSSPAAASITAAPCDVHAGDENASCGAQSALPTLPADSTSSIPHTAS